MKIHVLVDKWKYREDAEVRILRSLKDTFPKYISHTKKGEWFLKFTGLLAYKNQLVFSLPCGLVDATELKRSDMNDLIPYAALTMKSLRQYKEEGSKDSRGIDEISTVNEISLSIEILDDYHKHGLLNRRIRERKAFPSGRIDWNRTVARTSMVMSTSGVFYPEPIRCRQLVSEDNPLTAIHKACVDACADSFGWITGETDDINLEAMSDEIRLPYSKEESLAILRKELSSTFSDREMNLIRNLIQYIARRGEYKESLVSYGTSYYWEVWERACQRLFQDDRILYEKILPQPRWQKKQAGVVTPRISQKPDVITIHNATIYVLDAKYYEYRQTMPGWGDVVKQFFYEKSINDYAGLKKLDVDLTHTSNALILPGPPRSGIVHLADVSFPSMPEYRKLPAFSIDCEKALRIYTDRNPDPAKRKAYLQTIVGESSMTISVPTEPSSSDRTPRE